MRPSIAHTLATSALLALLWTGAAAAGGYKPPRTASGRPDLQGLWTNASLTHLERMKEFGALVITEAEASAYEARQDGAPVVPGDNVDQAKTEWWDQGGYLGRLGGEVRTSWIVDPPDGRLPYTEAGEKTVQRSIAGLLTAFDGPEARTAADRCLLGSGGVSGPPMLNTGYNNNYQIVQTPEHLAIVVEMNHDTRIIPLKAGPPAPDQIQPWMGRSVGRWEGDTLVVETDRFNPTGSWRSPGHFYLSSQAHVTERFTRTGRDEIRYEFTVSDPAIFSRTWRGEMALRRAKGPIYEVACHEGNYAMSGMLAGGRQKEREAAQAASAGR
ncbi:hypothetical protein [Phenylobacterium sp.]|uniref:hypothetical protein n=1 Tax=Phenylobacterium sp. TaxID=1871053 RepID=UPI0035663192